MNKNLRFRITLLYWRIFKPDLYKLASNPLIINPILRFVRKIIKEYELIKEEK